MRYEHLKVFIASLSIASVITAIIVTLRTNMLVGDYSRAFTLSIALAAILAGVAAFMTIIVSRRLTREREKRRVFLIYACEDLEAARKLAVDLREQGFNPWLDVEEITPGQVWQKAVIHALEKSVVAIVLVSKNFSKKGFVQEELKVALEILQEREKDISPIIPVRLDDSEVPERLSHIHWVNLFDENGLDLLSKGLSRITSERHTV